MRIINNLNKGAKSQCEQTRIRNMNARVESQPIDTNGTD